MKNLIGREATVGGRKLEVSMSPYPHMKEINVLGADFFSKYHLYVGYSYRTRTVKIHFDGDPAFH